MSTLTALPIPHVMRARHALIPLHLTSSSSSISSPTPDAILQLGFAFWGSKTLLSAVELDVFSELARTPGTCDDLSERLGLHERSARDFLDALVALGLLQRTGRVYSNTSAADRFLDKAKPTYVGGILEMTNERLYRFWGGL